MEKYLQIFKISFQQEFAYRLNFIMWRFRNIMQFFLVFFLWDTIFSDPRRSFFGYNRAEILTYVFGLILIRSIVLSIRSIDVAGEIARGDISNLLLKPISYFKYWFTRDISSKALNFFFAVGEITLLYLLLQPNFFLQKNLVIFCLFLISLVFAVVLYFLLVFLFSQPTFWYPHQAWGFIFLLIILVDLLGGGVFPLDILPSDVQKIVYFSPFPYLLFIPIEIYLGKLSFLKTLVFLAISLAWVLVLIFVNKRIWTLGVRSYSAEGR